MPLLQAEHLKSISERIFSRLGASDEESRIVSDHLVNANLHGVDSHGVIRISEYVRDIRAGKIRLRVQPKILKESACTVMVSGEFGFGQVTGVRAMNLALERARKFGAGIVGICNCNHLGRIGEYVMIASQSDAVGMVIAKGPAIVAPHGGKSRMLGANPISVGIPANKERPILVDFSTSTAAEGKLRVKRARGERIPAGWIVDKDGNTSTDPSDFYTGGALLPFGEHKGYALSVAIEVLAGLLTGAGSLTKIAGVNGGLMLALSIESFSTVSKFKSEVDELIRDVKGSARNANDEILVPGEVEFREYKTRTSQGIPVDETTWTGIADIATQLQLDLASSGELPGRQSPSP